MSAYDSPGVASWRSVETENQRNRSIYLGTLHWAIVQLRILLIVTFFGWPEFAIL